MMHAPAKVQQLIAPRTACEKLYAHLPRGERVSDDTTKYPITCTQCRAALKLCICEPGDPCDYHAATCVTCTGGCSGHPVNLNHQPG